VVKIPWETTDQYIRSGHRDPSDFEQDSLRTITLSEEEGIKAVVGKLKGEDKTTVQSYLFDKDKWSLEKAKAWFEQHHREARHEHFCYVTPILERIVDKPLKIRGVALTAGISRNLNIYMPEELQNFASKLAGSPVYLEHVSAFDAVGKVTKADWNPDSKTLSYEAEIYDDETAEKIRKGLIQHVSIGADYERIDILDGKVPHGLHNAELSLVAVPGIPETNVHIVERLNVEKGSEPKPSLQDLMKLVEERFAQVNKRLDEIAKPKPQLAEAEWDTEYINNLPDEAFAYIESGGSKDEQGKTVPRSLRHLPYKNAQGNLDPDHVRNALARLDQTDIPAEGKAEAKKKLCDAAKELNIVSEVCGLAEQKSLAEELLKSTAPSGPNLIDKREILRLIPEERVVRSWSYGPRLLVHQLRHKLSTSGSSLDWE